jgi:hypothetical protein
MGIFNFINSVRGGRVIIRPGRQKNKRLYHSLCQDKIQVLQFITNIFCLLEVALQSFSTFHITYSSMVSVKHRPDLSPWK